MNDLTRYQVMAAALVAAAAMAAAPAEAASTGDQLTCLASNDLRPPVERFCSPPTAMLSSGIEFEYGFLGPGTSFSPIFDIDFSSNQLAFILEPRAVANFAGAAGASVSFSNLTSAFTSATLLATTNVSGFSQNNITLSDGLLTLRLTGSLFDARDARASVVIALTSAPPVPPAIPEPATWATMLLGFGLIGFGARRRGRTVASA